MCYLVKILITSVAVISWVGCGGPISPTDQDQNTNDVCVSGDTRPGETVCGLNGEGLFGQVCSGGVWVDDASSCDGDALCINGTLQVGTTVCG